MTWTWKDELEIYRQAKLKGDIRGREKSHCKDFEEPGLLEKVSAAVGHRVWEGEGERAGRVQHPGAKVSVPS